MSKKRYHVQDTQSSMSSEFYNDDQGTSVSLAMQDVKSLTATCEKLMSRNKVRLKKKLTFRGQGYEVVLDITRMVGRESEPRKEEYDKSEGFDWSIMINRGEKTDGSGYLFDVNFTHANGNVGRLTYRLYNVTSINNATKGWRLHFIGNPTTIINGHNTRAAILRNRAGFVENLRMHRLGFEFFFDILNVQTSAKLAEDLKVGNISLQNTQFAVYVKSANKARDLNLLKILYCRLSVLGDHAESGGTIARYLNLKTEISDEENTGVMLRAFQGPHALFTFNAYDKELSNTQRNKTISARDQKLTKRSLRLDLTLHRRYMERLAARADTIVKKRIQKLKEAKEPVPKPYTLFRVNVAAGRINALTMCMIMHVMSEGYTSFAHFLMKEIISDNMMLDKIIGASQTSLEKTKDDLSERHYALYSSWVECTTQDEWQIRKKNLETTLKVSSVTLYREIVKLEELLGVSMDVPYPFWVQTTALDAVYGLNREQLCRVAEILDKKSNEDQSKEYLELMRKGRRKAVTDRKELAKTFLLPIGMYRKET